MIPEYPGNFGTLEDWQAWRAFLYDGDFRPHLNDILNESIAFAENRISLLEKREDQRKGDCGNQKPGDVTVDPAGDKLNDGAFDEAQQREQMPPPDVSTKPETIDTSAGNRDGIDTSDDDDLPF